jgi:hypothetical protein
LGFAAQWLFCSLTIGKKHNKMYPGRMDRPSRGLAGGVRVMRWVRVVIASNNLFKVVLKGQGVPVARERRRAGLALG